MTEDGKTEKATGAARKAGKLLKDGADRFGRMGTVDPASGSPPPPPPPPQQSAPVPQQTVIVKRGCSICGCGCALPTLLVPILTLALWAPLGWIGLLLALPTGIGSVHALAAVGRFVGR
jgi:hypothetical protein